MSSIQFLMPCRKQQRGVCVYIYIYIYMYGKGDQNYWTGVSISMEFWAFEKNAKGAWEGDDGGMGVLCTENENERESLMPSMITFIEFWRCIDKKALLGLTYGNEHKIYWTGSVSIGGADLWKWAQNLLNRIGKHCWGWLTEIAQNLLNWIGCVSSQSNCVKQNNQEASVW